MSDAAARDEPSSAPARPALRIAFAVALALAFCGFVALGAWQLQRMAWKHDLVARVDARIHAAPSALPARTRWASVDAAGDEYRRVRVSGRFLDVPTARVQAVTERGAGWWLLSPLETDGGDLVLINRGFVPAGTTFSAPPTGPTAVTGLLRLTEPRGGFLRDNDPAGERWHSRDVAALAASRGLDASRTAPFFIDADRATSPGAGPGAPRGGLTVVRFRDNHLSYALTWFGMALLTLVAAVCLFRMGPGLRHHRPHATGTDRDAVSPAGR